ncbi:MAG: hypothetical protein COB02_09690 [Candidatus Cloacimonadota bacterium]|nr:MAG: hypothetical protein COB02_09690 [Candidatus Cloacimonadota bacterium]
MKIDENMKIASKSEYKTTWSPIENLIPYNGEKKESAIVEYFIFNDKTYSLLSSNIEASEVIVHKNSILILLSRVVNFYDWKNQFHPIDLIQWQKVFDFFSLGNFTESNIFGDILKKQNNLLVEVQKADNALISLILLKKVDFRLIHFLINYGFKMNIFYQFLFKEGTFNFQMQKKIIECFGSYFRRNTISPNDFLVEHKEDILQKMVSKNIFIAWMNELTKPSQTNELKRRQGFLKQIKLDNHINVRLDETLEDAWINFQFQVENIEDYKEIIKDLSFVENQSYIEDFFEEC